MKLNRITTQLLAVALATGSPIVALAQNAPKANTVDAKEAAQDWNAPPAGTEQAQQAFRDGMLAAKLDKTANRKVDAKSSHLYLHPPVKGDAAKNEYRNGFEQGYNKALAPKS